MYIYKPSCILAGKTYTVNKQLKAYIKIMHLLKANNKRGIFCRLYIISFSDNTYYILMDKLTNKFCGT